MKENMWIEDALKTYATSNEPDTEDRYFSALVLIHDLCIGYDGFDTVSGLKGLIDEIKAISIQARILP